MTKKQLQKAYTVFVDDNFHYRDEDQRYELGTFPTLGEAVGAAKQIVDDYLKSTYEPGMTAASLYNSYVSFGDDPFIVPSGEISFSAWDYAKQRCEEICIQKGAAPKRRSRGEACYVDKDGEKSNQALHDEIMEGVPEDAERILWAREELKGVLTPEQLDAVLPLPK